MTRVRELIAAETIDRVKHVDFEAMLHEQAGRLDLCCLPHADLYF